VGTCPIYIGMPVPIGRHIAVHMKIGSKVEMEAGLPIFIGRACGRHGLISVLGQPMRKTV